MIGPDDSHTKFTAKLFRLVNIFWSFGVIHLYFSSQRSWELFRAITSSSTTRYEPAQLRRMHERWEKVVERSFSVYTLYRKIH